VAGLFSGSISDPNQFLISSILHSSTLANNIHGTLLYSSFQRLLEIGFDFMMGRVWFLVSVGARDSLVLHESKAANQGRLREFSSGEDGPLYFSGIIGGAYRLSPGLLLHELE